MKSTLDETSTDHERLHRYGLRMEEALRRAIGNARARAGGAPIPEFDLRSELYALAHEVAPSARSEELQTLLDWLQPQRGEVGVEIAAGSGFLTKNLCARTGATVYAIDPSAEQLNTLHRAAPLATPVLGHPDASEIFHYARPGSIDFAASLGGIHHVADQQAMFANVAKLLRRGGRFVMGDGCEGTTVTSHFDQHVASKCLTGHTAKWLTPQRIGQFIQHLPFRTVRMEVVPICMSFTSDEEMFLFFKGLHAYDLPRDEILAHLENNLGTEFEAGNVLLKWPLLFGHFERI